VALFAGGYLSAANGAAAAYAGLTAGAAHLVEAFGSEEVRRTFHEPMISGRWSGTMALTEPHAGSSLADVRTTATPMPGGPGRYLLRGNKVFISGGDQDFTENIVHLALGRIEGAPAGIKGISLFAVPRLRPEDGHLVDNDCSSAGVFHKMGWRGIPSIALNFGERGDCIGWLVGTPHQGLAHMFQMMNEARLMVGMNGVATASAAYQESLEYARTRPQGRPLAARDPRSPQIPIVEHADVRRMLLKQKAIVEGGLSLLAECARLADLGRHGPEEGRGRWRRNSRRSKARSAPPSTRRSRRSAPPPSSWRSEAWPATAMGCSPTASTTSRRSPICWWRGSGRRWPPPRAAASSATALPPT